MKINISSTTKNLNELHFPFKRQTFRLGSKTPKIKLCIRNSLQIKGQGGLKINGWANPKAWMAILITNSRPKALSRNKRMEWSKALWQRLLDAYVHSLSPLLTKPHFNLLQQSVLIQIIFPILFYNWVWAISCKQRLMGGACWSLTQLEAIPFCLLLFPPSWLEYVRNGWSFRNHLATMTWRRAPLTKGGRAERHTELAFQMTTKPCYQPWTSFYHQVSSMFEKNTFLFI